MSEFRSHRDNERVLVEMWTVEATDGDHAAATLLSQLLWWFQNAKGTRRPRVNFERGGHLWLVRSDDGWWDDCRLTQRQVRRIRVALVKRGLVVHRRFKVNGAPTGAWRPDLDVVEAFIAEYETKRLIGQSADSPSDESGDPPTSEVTETAVHEPVNCHIASLPVVTDLNNSTPKGLTAPVVVNDDVQMVLDAWQAAAGKRSVARTPERVRLITNQRRFYPLADLVDAVRGWRWSPHHCGDNERGTVYNDLGLLLRNAEKIEQFRDWERGINRPAPKATGRATRLVENNARVTAEWLREKEAQANGTHGHSVDPQPVRAALQPGDHGAPG